MLLRQIFDPQLAQFSYLIGCPESGEALIVDPQRDIDRYRTVAEAEGLEIVAAVETHIHADFLSGAREFAAEPRMRIYLSAEGGPEWQYGWAASDAENGSSEVILLRNGDTISLGCVELRALHTPGHTPEHLSYLVIDRGREASAPIGILSGDFVLVGDLGRPDLLEKTAGTGASAQLSARDLYRSLAIFTALGDELQLWPGHGAGSSCGKSIGAVPTSTVGYEKRHNRTLESAAAGEGHFVTAILEGQQTPPMYFARMKRENRAGPPLLRRLPRPRGLMADELAAIAAHGETVVIDTRPDRGVFMAGHLPGSLYAPFDRSFSTTVGSLLVEATRPMVLLVDGESLEAAVRSLIRIGYDQIVAHFDASVLDAYFESGGEKGVIPEVEFAEIGQAAAASDAVVVDVRDRFEYAEGHVPGAVNAPHTRLPEFVESRIPQGRALIVHCESGARSAVASAWLAARGRQVLYVNDDWSAWVDSGGDVERGGAGPLETNHH